MARLLVFIVLLIQCATSWATVVARNGTELGVRDVHARQAPSERLVGRVDCACVSYLARRSLPGG